MFYLGAILLVFIGVVHSYLGERYILIRLFRKHDLPKLLGGTEFTKNTLRFAWHLTTVAWFGFAALLVHLASGTISLKTIGLIISVTFILHGVVALLGSKAKHLSWPIFLVIGLAVLYGSHA